MWDGSIFFSMFLFSLFQCFYEFHDFWLTLDLLLLLVRDGVFSSYYQADSKSDTFSFTSYVAPKRMQKRTISLPTYGPLLRITSSLFFFESW